MARDPADTAIQQAYAAEFAQLTADTGWNSPEDLPDEQYRTISNEILRRHVGDLYGAAIAQDGAGLDPSVAPAFASRLAQTGASHAQVREFAAQLYPHLTPQAAVARYGRDLRRANGEDVKEPADKLYDRPY